MLRKMLFGISVGRQPNSWQGFLNVSLSGSFWVASFSSERAPLISAGKTVGILQCTCVLEQNEVGGRTSPSSQHSVSVFSPVLTPLHSSVLLVLWLSFSRDCTRNLSPFLSFRPGVGGKSGPLCTSSLESNLRLLSFLFLTFYNSPYSVPCLIPA